ncbi:unnamed protein product [Ectocarpus sp. CCAP 1310/34]|nr:unnamed protein product [Ectocarpus sp. CCAP 1310/34]
MKKAKGAKPPTSPLILQLLIPKGMAQPASAVGYILSHKVEHLQLPVVDAGTRESLPLEEEVNRRLLKQIDWAPPGSEPLTSPSLRADPRAHRGVRPLKSRLFAMRAKGTGTVYRTLFHCRCGAMETTRWRPTPRQYLLYSLRSLYQVLRSLLKEVFLDRPSEAILFSVWCKEQKRVNEATGGSASFEMAAGELRAEWRMVMEAVKTPSAHLSSFHVFVLAHVLRRPIVVYGKNHVYGANNSEAFVPSDMPGNYLPTLEHQDKCYKSAIAVAYTCPAVGRAGHFSPLVGMSKQLKYIPSVDEHGKNLRVR